VPSLAIVTGSPASGKTTLCRALAAASPDGLHLTTDRFYEFPAHPRDPTRPEAREQNAAVVAAFCRAAAAFAESGYEVYVDGIVGPWMLPVAARELGGLPVDYAVLRIDLDEAVRRAAARDGPESERAVRHMHRAFGDLGAYERHAIDADRPGAALADAFRRRRASGALRLDWEAVSSGTLARRER